MKTYKVLKAWEGVEVGEELKSNHHGVTSYSDSFGGNHFTIKPHEIAILLHLGFIEEVEAVKKKFVPKDGDKYWYVSEFCNVDWHYNDDDYSDEKYIRLGNCYRTEAEALEARERVLKAY